MKSLEELEDSLRVKSIDILANRDKNERIAWLQHPITQALLMQLKADYLHGVVDFSAGAFVADTIDKTAAEAMKLMVQVQGLNEFIQSIEEMKDDDGSEDVDAATTSEQQSTY